MTTLLMGNCGVGFAPLRKGPKPKAVADLNLIDPRRLSVGTPRLVRDLPAGGRRLLQTGVVYLGTRVAGQCVQRGGQLSEARPGALVRAAS